MEIAFRTQSLRKLCENENSMRQRLGPDAAEVLKVCLADMRAAGTIDEVLSTTVEEVLKAKGRLMSAYLSDGYHLIVGANHVNNPIRPDGKVDWSGVSRVKIMGIEHDD